MIDWGAVRVGMRRHTIISRVNVRSFNLSLLLGAAVLAAAPVVLVATDAGARQPVDYVKKAAGAFKRDATVSSARIPAWLDNDGTVIKSVNASVLENDKHPMTIKDGVATASLVERKQLTWMAKMVAIPPQSKACTTVYLKFHDDFKPGDGGKLPGLSNTGMGRPVGRAKPEMVDGMPYPNSGWGGRKADGVHWSARTGFGGWTETIG